MVGIVKIKRDNTYLAQPFLRIYSQAEFDPAYTSEDIIKDDRISLIARVNNNQHILKLVKPRTWHEYPKLVWGHSTINKEINGNRILHGLNIHVPQVVEYGLGLLPAVKYQYIGYYIMENLEAKDMKDVATMLLSDDLSNDVRNTVLAKIAHDLSNMRKHLVLFSDLRLSNVFSDAEGRITWIDTGATPYSTFFKKRYENKFKASVLKMLKPYRQELRKEEIARFETLVS